MHKASLLRIDFLSRDLTMIPGIRLENFIYERDIFRINYRDTSITNNDNIFALVGIWYQLQF